MVSKSMINYKQRLKEYEKGAATITYYSCNADYLKLIAEMVWFKTAKWKIKELVLEKPQRWYACKRKWAKQSNW